MAYVNYSQKDYNTIFEGYLRKAADNKLIDGNEDYIQDILQNKDYIENVLIMELAIHSEILAETYTKLTQQHNTHDLDKATGQDLDQLLEPFIKRHQSTYATTHICFQKETNTLITIPAGTIITSTQYPEIQFQTLIPTTLTKDEELIQATCTTPGPTGNIPSHTLNKILPKISGLKKVYNPQAAIGGRNREDDDSYRLRGRNWTNINTQGTLSAFKNSIESVASVEGYYIQRRWDGPGTTKIIINPPTKSVLEAVNEVLSHTCAVDEEYTVIGAVNTPINININITIQTEEKNPPGTLEKQKTTLQIQKALKTYIEGDYEEGVGKVGGLSLGEDFIPSRATAHLLNTLPTVKDVTITYPANIISIDYYQKAVCGEVQIEIL